VIDEIVDAHLMISYLQYASTQNVYTTTGKVKNDTDVLGPVSLHN